MRTNGRLWRRFVETWSVAVFLLGRRQSVNGRPSAQAAASFAVVLLGFLAALPLGSSAVAATTTASAGSCTNEALSGGNDWDNPDRAQTDSGTYAETASKNGESSDGLYCRNFGFAIPSGAVINGITATIERRSASANTHRDSLVVLAKTASPPVVTASKASATFYPTTDTAMNYGGPSDLWGTTWTAAQINNGDFGVGLVVTNASGSNSNRRAYVDYVQVTVDYTANCTSNVASGNWNTSSTWTNCRGGVPLAGDTVTILNGHSVTLNTSPPSLSLLTNNGTLTDGGISRTLTMGGNLVNAGTLNLSNTTVRIDASATWSGAGTWNLGTIDFNWQNQSLTLAAGATFTLNLYGSTPIDNLSSGFGSFNAGANTAATVKLARSGAQTIRSSGIVYPNLTLSGSGDKTPDSWATLDIRGSLTIDSGVSYRGDSLSPVVDLYGNLANSGTFSSGWGTFTFRGTSGQSISGATAFLTLRINNANGVTINSDVTLSTNGTLTLSSGNIVTGGNNFIFAGDCFGGYTLNRTSGYVQGNVRLNFPGWDVSCLYPVGDSIGYAPMTVNKSGSNAGTLVGRVDGGDHPDGSGAIGINQSRNANHYWTLTTGTLSSATPYSATFQFCATGTCSVPAEVDSGAATGSFGVAKKSGTWSSQTVGTRTSTTTQATGLTGFGVFEVGEANLLAAPTTVKAFGAASIAPGGTSTLSITITNANGTAITGLAFTDSYPSNVVNAATPALANSCGGTATGAPGAGSLSLSGATLAANASCTVSISVTSAVAGSYLNSTGAVTSSNAASGAAASATLTVSAAPATCGSGAIASGVLNTYYPGTASAAAGATSISVGSSSGAATAIATNDLLLIVQMQDQNIGTTNTSSYGTASGTPTAGQYEYAVAAGPVSGGVLTLTAGLANSYTASAYGSNGQKTFQIIRVPVYSSATLPASGLTAQAWNGSTGGVLALDVVGTLNLNSATVDVSGKGFRGGGGCRWVGDDNTSGLSASDYRRTASTTCPSTDQNTGRANGLKGEGIAGTPRYVYDGSTRVNTGVEGYPNGSTGRGAPGNAGGGGTDDDPVNNDENTGGGGGAGYGSGGTGGYAWSNAASPGRGLGGTGVMQSATKLTLGGGGGGGTSNNGTADGNGLNSSGVAGGGIVLIRAGSLTGTATITADGSNNTLSVGNDGSGGGGGGGAILLSAASGLSGVTASAKGGSGGTNTGDGSNHGPGGGGGGGYVLTTAAPAGCTVSGGNNGTTAGGAAYGASAGSAGECATNGSLALGSGACVPSISHYAISHSGAGITCEAEPVTFTAHDASHSRVAAAGRTLSITATNAAGGAATGTWVASDGSVCSTTCYDTSGIAVSCANTPTYTPTGTSTGAASYLFAVGESGIRLCLKQSSAITQNINITDGSATEGSSEDATLAFANSGFRFYADGSVDTLGNLVAGLRSDVTDATYQSAPQVLTVRAVKSSETTPARCVPLVGSATKTVKFAYQCIEPASCHASSSGLEVNGTTVTGSGSVPTPSSDVSVAFNASGYGSINLKYWDVGQIKLFAQAAISDAATGGTATIATGSSNTFLVRPFGFSVIPCITLSSGECASAPADPGTTGGGTALIKAGSPFNATVKAVAYGGTTVTPSFGLGTGKDTESAALSYTLMAPTNVCSGGTANCSATLGGTTSLLRSAFGSGKTTVTDLTWSEVGVITLTATNAAFQGTTLSPAALGTSGNLGRFYPHHFGLTGAVQTRSDLLPITGSAFTYMGEPMRMTLTVTAYNAGESATQNYAGAFAKLNATGTGGLGSTTTNWTCISGSQCMGLGAVNGSTGLSARLSIDTTAGFGSSAPSNIAWSGGGSSFTAFVIFGRPGGGAVDGPYQALRVGAKPLDSDGVTLPPRNSTDTTHCVDLDVTTGTENASCDPGTTEANLRRKLFQTDVRFGRLSVANASGSERQSLPVPITAWYYKGSTGWVVNTDDSLTGLPTAFTAHPGNTTDSACYGAACTGNAGGGVNSMVLTKVGDTSIVQAAKPISAAPVAGKPGQWNITLDKPSTQGVLDFVLVVPPWLKTNVGEGGAGSDYDRNPKGRITFGVPATGNKTKFIYIRENY